MARTSERGNDSIAKISNNINEVVEYVGTPLMPYHIHHKFITVAAHSIYEHMKNQSNSPLSSMSHMLYILYSIQRTYMLPVSANLCKEGIYLLPVSPSIVSSSEICHKTHEKKNKNDSHISRIVWHSKTYSEDRTRRRRSPTSRIPLLIEK